MKTQFMFSFVWAELALILRFCENNFYLKIGIYMYPVKRLSKESLDLELYCFQGKVPVLSCNICNVSLICFLSVCLCVCLCVCVSVCSSVFMLLILCNYSSFYTVLWIHCDLDLLHCDHNVNLLTYFSKKPKPTQAYDYWTFSYMSLIFHQCICYNKTYWIMSKYVTLTFDKFVRNKLKT